MSASPIVAPPYGSPEWLAWRRRGLGASDLPALTGDNPWLSEYQMAAVKRGLDEGDAGNSATRWGHRLERVGIEFYQEQTGRMVATGETFARPDFPHIFATLDGRVPGDAIGVEVKSTRHRWEELPRRVVVQALGQMGCADLAAVDVVVLPFPEDPFIVRVERDEAAIADLLALGEEWWARYVEGDEMPPLDGSPAATKALRALRGDEERIASEDQQQWLRSLVRVRTGIKELEEADRGLVRAIKASMAGAGVLVAPEARVTWSATKPRTSVAWQQVAEGLRTRVTPEEWEAVVSLATTVGEPGDTFRVWPAKIEEKAA